MKIGMILDKEFPSDVRVENEAQLLIENGHEVHLFCWNFTKDIQFEKKQGIHIYRYNLSKLLYNKFSPLAFSIPIYHIILKNKLMKFFKQVNLDAIHIHDMVAAKVVQQLITDKPLVLDLHENRPEIMKYYTHVNSRVGKMLINPKVWKNCEKKAILETQKLVVVTPEAKDYYVKMISQLQEENVIVAPNTIYPAIFYKYPQNDKILQKNKNDFVILYVGAIAKRRGLDTAIKSINLLKNKIPNIKLLMVGGISRDTKYLQELVSDLNLESIVKFEGWQDLSLFPSYIQSSNICISPLVRNIHHDTTYANKIFQYMSMGKPIIVSDCPSQKRIVEMEKCGLVHKAEDPSDLALQIEKLYNDTNLAKNLGSNGAESILTKYNWSSTGKALVELYAAINKR